MIFRWFFFFFFLGENFLCEFLPKTCLLYWQGKLNIEMFCWPLEFAAVCGAEYYGSFKKKKKKNVDVESYSSLPCELWLGM